MTIVCGYFDAETRTAYMASDTRATGDNFIYPGRQTKIYSAGNWLIGASGSGLMGQLIAQHPIALSEAPDVFVLARNLRELMEAAGFESDKSEPGPPEYPEHFLAALRGVGVWRIGMTGVVDRAEPFYAIGSGQDFAWGASHALLWAGDASVKDVLRAAVHAAMTFDTHCGGEVDMHTLLPTDDNFTDEEAPPAPVQTWKQKRGLT